MKEAPSDKPQPLTTLSEAIGGGYKTFSAITAGFQVQVEILIQGVKKEVEELGACFRGEVKAKNLWLSHQLVFVEKRVPQVVWVRIRWGGGRPVPVSTTTFKSNRLFQCQYINGELKDLLMRYEALVVEVRVRLAKLIALRNALSAFTQ